MLAAVIGLYVISDLAAAARHLRLRDLTATLHLSNGVQDGCSSGFFIAFAVKAPLFPFHTWLPDAGAEARPAVRCCLSVSWTRSARSASCATASRCSHYASREVRARTCWC